MKQNRRSAKLLVRFLVTYLSILVVLSVFSVILFNVSLRIIEESIEKSNRRILEQSMKVTEGKFYETSLLLFQLVCTQNVKEFIYSSRSDETHFQTAMRVQSDLGYLLEANQFLDGLYIYSTYNDMVLSQNAYYEVNTFFGRYVNHSRVGYAEWFHSVLPSSHFGRYLPAASVRLFDLEGEYLTVVWTIPVGIRGQYDGAFIGFVKAAKIQNILDAVDLSHGGYAAIYDGDGARIIRRSADDEGPSGDDLSNGRFIESRVVSEKTGWTYVSVLPFASVMAPALRFRTISWTIIGFMFLLGAAVSFVMARVNAGPIDSMIRMLGEFGVKPQVKGSGQYDYLRSSVSGLIDQNRRLSVALDESVPIIRRSFFENLLNGGFTGRDDFEAYKAKLAMDIRGMLFATLIIRHGDGTRGDVENGVVRYGSIYGDVLKTVGITMDRLLWVHECGADTLAVIVSWPDRKMDDFRLYLTERIDLLASELAAYSPSFRIAIGGIYGDLLDSKLSFKEAHSTVSWMMGRSGSAPVMWYDESTFDETSNPYTLVFEQRLVNQVMLGEREAVGKLLEELYTKSVVQQRLSPPILQVLKYEITGTVIRIIQDAGLLDRMEEVIRGIDQDADIDAFFEEVGTQLGNLCDILRDGRAIDASFFRTKIADIIRKHFTDSEFTIETLSEMAGISTASLNRYFRRYVGFSFAKYLENVRIETAQALLENTEKPISLVAYETGYSSDKSFRRAFKRMTGTSPRTFRTGASFEEADRKL